MREPKKVRTRPELVKSCRALRVFNAELKERIKELETENTHLKTGFQGACWCCEPVGELNLKLLAKLAEADKKLRDMQATIATFNIV